MQLRVLHVTGAVLGGAITGGIIAGGGAMLIRAPWRPWIIAAIALWALALSVRRRSTQLGRRWQVPREWNKTMPPHRRYFLWGMLLGCGLLTPISYPAFLLFLGVQATAGVILGILSGALFGGVREILALYPGLRRCSLAETAAFLPRLGASFRFVNVIVVVGGGLLLVLARWH